MTDEELLSLLVDEHATRPANIEPGESMVGRLIVVGSAPIWLAATVAITALRLVRAKRPVIVLHERVGYERQPLWVPKLATAAVASNDRRLLGLVEVATGPPVEIEVDGRLEQWLRVTGLDELPQLFLVLGGSMRLVGPRPVTPSEVDEMVADVPHSTPQVGVDHLHPGLIGLWQVLDRHGYELPERRVLDMQMVDNWSPRLRRQLLAIAVRQAVARLRRR